MKLEDNESNNEVQLEEENEVQIEEEKGGIVIPAVLWWMGAPLTLLLVLWLFGVF